MSPCPRAKKLRSKTRKKAERSISIVKKWPEARFHHLCACHGAVSRCRVTVPCPRVTGSPVSPCDRAKKKNGSRPDFTTCPMSPCRVTVPCHGAVSRCRVTVLPCYRVTGKPGDRAKKTKWLEARFHHLSHICAVSRCRVTVPCHGAVLPGHRVPGSPCPRAKKKKWPEARFHHPSHIIYI